MDLTTSNGIEPANSSAETGQSAGGEAPGMAVTVIEEAAPADGQAACARTDGFKHDTKTGQGTLEVGLNPATQSFQRMTDQVKQVLGMHDFEAEEQTRCASQNLQAVTQASTVLVRGAQEVSREWFGLVQEQLTKRVEGLNRMAGSRSVRAFVAAQSELMRDNLQLAIDTNRRMAALSVRIADEAADAIQAQADASLDHARRAA
jgi:phasin family protein